MKQPPATSASDLHSLFDAHAAELAPHLLGCELTVTTARGPLRVRLTEVEAYGDQGEDPGAHSYTGRTARNASLFGPPRRTYVYLSYGIHCCLNLVANAAGAGGVLLRAAEVMDGRELAVARRGGRDTGAKLLSGPGRLGQGLGVTLPMDGSALEISEAGDVELSPPNREVSFHLAPPSSPVDASTVRSGPRVGVSGVGGSMAFPWRFWLDGERSVSAYRPGKNVPDITAG
ncbi:DNA-3-methyladenine glycosylase [Nesterenkonia massiliensis]|uniref:DNA-3-methyladenine glycosylase n=1 Tax=Nesterenkonia massiliensis TaxID=1232429 RepID=UPI0005CA829F|nr:DNA-3-methyladenine glycosylase [Nesterenkonia massiliensis]